ncbi:MAG: hypothetical protein ACR2PL_17490 [Dehalococcoidia bacterium]
MKTLVAMNPEGRLTLPAIIRWELGVEGEAQFEVEVFDNAVILRPVVVLPREDAWAYTPEHRKRLQKAHQDSREGRVRQVSERELEQLAPVAPDA